MIQRESVKGLEMIINALPHADIRKCYLTGGINPSDDGIQIKLPKTQMASTLVALFDDGRVPAHRPARRYAIC